MLQYVMKSRCASLMADQAKFCGAIHFSLCQFDKVAVTYHHHRRLFVWNCDTESCEPDSSYQVRQTLHVWFRLFVSCLLQAHQTLELRKNLGYSLNQWMLNNLQSIAHEYCYQHLDSPETDPSQYISNHPWIEWLSKWYQVDMSYHRTRLTYSRLTGRIQPSISSHRNEVLAHQRSTLLSSVKVSDLTPHAYSIHRPLSTCQHSLFTYDPTPGTPLNREYLLCIIFESVAASTQSVICPTLNV